MRTPTKFVGLHAHSTIGSIGDAIGLPGDHIEFAFNNGSDALALTDHGNMNGISHQQVKLGDMKKAGKQFKGLIGIEAYFIDDITAHTSLRQQRKIEEQQAKAAALAAKPSKKKTVEEEAVAELEETVGNEQKADEDDVSGTIIEVEAESKNLKYLDPVNQRNHLVLLAKNNAGVKALFQLCSEGFKRGFYRFPRVDFELLQKYTNGNVVATSACVAGRLSYAVMKEYADILSAEDKTEWFDTTTERFLRTQEELKTLYERFAGVMGGYENFYPEIQFNKLPEQNLVNLHLLHLAKKYPNIKLVATADSHYASPSQWREREIYKAMTWQSRFKGVVDKNMLPQKIEELKCELYPKNHEQMWEAYKQQRETYPFYEQYDEAVCNAVELTHSIAHDLIADPMIDTKVKLPAIEKLIPSDKLESFKSKVENPEDEDALAHKQLTQLCTAALRDRGKVNPEYVERLRYELDVIKHLKNAKYFLTYHKIMAAAGEKMILGNGRGSAAGSLVSYLLRITAPDPIKYGLLFSRFLSYKKTGMPDIDSDSSDRDQMIETTLELFGEDDVVPITSFQQLQLKSLIKDLARFEGLPFDEINKMTGAIERETLAVDKQKPGFDRGVWFLTYESALENSQTFQKLLEMYPVLEEGLKVLFKQMRSQGRHAGGVLVTNNAPEHLPLIRVGGDIQTPWTDGVNFRHLEMFGFLKFDFLGLGTLRMFEECVRKILVKEGNKNPTFKQIKQWFEDRLHPDVCDYDDPNVYKHVYWNNHYAGVFQFINPKVQEFAAQLKPTNIHDLAAITSIFRPGPLSAGVDRMFLQNRKNPQSIVYKHPLLKEVLGSTAGLLVYQEQLQMVYHKLAGVPLDETDGVRKAFTKKEISNKDKAKKDREKLRDEFLVKCKTANDIPERVSGEIFDEMERLVAYSFNLSHALCYSIASYQCAYFLTYHPDEWIPTYIDYCSDDKGKVVGKEDPKVTAMREAKYLGYRFAKADINYSDYQTAMHPTEPKLIIPSFSSMKHVGKTAVEEIKRSRPYNTVEDLLVNVGGSWKHSKFNKRSLGTLIQLGALESMGLVGEGKEFANYRQLYHVTVDGYDKLKATTARKKNNEIKPVLDVLREEASKLEDWTTQEKIATQQELLGSVDINLLLPPDVREELDESGYTSIEEATDVPKVKGMHWAIVMAAKAAVTKNNKPYLKLVLTGDTGGMLQCFVWNYKGEPAIAVNDVIVGLFEKGDFGFSSFASTIKKLKKR